MGAAKVQGFRKGDLVDSRREDSPIYSLYIQAEVKSAPSSALHSRVLAGKGLTVTLLSGFWPAANATQLGSFGTGGSRPVSIALCCSSGSGTGSSNGQFARGLHAHTRTVRPCSRYIAAAVRLTPVSTPAPGPGAVVTIIVLQPPTRPAALPSVHGARL